jgi:hypothetical protein
MSIVLVRHPSTDGDMAGAGAGGPVGSAPLMEQKNDEAAMTHAHTPMHTQVRNGAVHPHVVVTPSIPMEDTIPGSRTLSSIIRPARIGGMNLLGELKKLPSSSLTLAAPISGFSGASLMSSLTIPVSSSSLRKAGGGLSPPSHGPPVALIARSPSREDRERSPPVLASILSETPPLGPQSAPSRDPQVIMAEYILTPPPLKRKIAPSPSGSPAVSPALGPTKTKKPPVLNEDVDALLQLAMFSDMAEASTSSGGQPTPKSSPSADRKRKKEGSGTFTSNGAPIGTQATKSNTVVASVIAQAQAYPTPVVASVSHGSSGGHVHKKPKIFKSGSTGSSGVATPAGGANGSSVVKPAVKAEQSSSVVSVNGAPKAVVSGATKDPAIATVKAEMGSTMFGAQQQPQPQQMQMMQQHMTGPFQFDPQCQSAHFAMRMRMPAIFFLSYSPPLHCLFLFSSRSQHGSERCV